MIHAWGVNKLSKMRHFCCVFVTFKTPHVRLVIESMFEVHNTRIILQVTQTRVVFLRPSHFCELKSTFNGISHYKLFEPILRTVLYNK